MEALKIKVKLDTPLEDVWHAWTDAATIVKWFSPEANVEPCLGGAFELFFDPQNHESMSTKGCVITEFEPMNRLSFNWKGPDQYADLMNDPRSLTLVAVEFSEDDGETSLSLHHGGWGEDDLWAEAREWHKKAWEGALYDLKRYLSGR